MKKIRIDNRNEKIIAFALVAVLLLIGTVGMASASAAMGIATSGGSRECTNWDISGTWDWTSSWESGSANAPMEIIQSGQGLSATWTGWWGTWDITGKIRGPNIELSGRKENLTFEECTYTLSSDGTTITGSCVQSDGTVGTVVAYGQAKCTDQPGIGEPIVPPSITALYRWWNGNTHDHFYTTNPSGEKAPTSGYVSEGIACYVATTQIPDTTPLYRWWHPTKADHFYTTNPSGGKAPTSGYVSEGITGYVWTTTTVTCKPSNEFYHRSIKVSGGNSDKGGSGVGSSNGYIEGNNIKLDSRDGVWGTHGATGTVLDVFTYDSENQRNKIKVSYNIIGNMVAVALDPAGSSSVGIEIYLRIYDVTEEEEVDKKLIYSKTGNGPYFNEQINTIQEGYIYAGLIKGHTYRVELTAKVSTFASFAGVAFADFGAYRGGGFKCEDCGVIWFYDEVKWA